MQTLHAVPAFQRLCDWFHLMVILAILVVSASSTQAATYSGSHLSSTIPTDVVLGADISVTNSVKNTGSATWYSFSEPGWIYAFRNISWQPGVTITHYVWNDVSPAAQDGDTSVLSGDDLPKTSGQYQFSVYAYYPVNGFSGNYNLMTGSPKVLQFTVTNPQPPTNTGTYDPTSDATLLDLNSQGLGYIAVAPGETVSVGENGTDQAGDRGWLAFALTSQARADISNAQTIYLNLTPSSRIDLESTNVYVDIYGLTNRTSASASGSDYPASGGVLLVGQAVTSMSPNTNLSFDVTSFVKAEAARSSSSVIVFRLQMGPSVPYLDGALNQFNFFSAESTNTSARPNLLLNGHPKINTPMLGTGGQFQFQLFGPVNSTNVIQASADLTTWTPITTNVISPAGFVPITDPLATNYSQRFYRAMSQ